MVMCASSSIVTFLLCCSSFASLQDVPFTFVCTNTNASRYWLIVQSLKSVQTVIFNDPHCFEIYG